MMETFLDFALGPFSSIGDFYYEHQLMINSVVVGVAFFKLLYKKKRTQSKSEN